MQSWCSEIAFRLNLSFLNMGNAAWPLSMLFLKYVSYSMSMCSNSLLHLCGKDEKLQYSTDLDAFLIQMTFSIQENNADCSWYSENACSAMNHSVPIVDLLSMFHHIYIV